MECSILGAGFKLEKGMLVIFSQKGRGGTPYGASTLAGPSNELEPKPEDLDIARFWADAWLR